MSVTFLVVPLHPTALGREICRNSESVQIEKSRNTTLMNNRFVSGSPSDEWEQLINWDEEMESKCMALGIAGEI